MNVIVGCFGDVVQHDLPTHQHSGNVRYVGSLLTGMANVYQRMDDDERTFWPSSYDSATEPFEAERAEVSSQKEPWRVHLELDAASLPVWISPS